MLAAGGFCVPTPVFMVLPESDWYCEDCRVKYPLPESYSKDCEVCRATGKVVRERYCDGCDHCCKETVRCNECDGDGSYVTHDCTPACTHNDRLGLPEISASRGGIKFS